MFVPLLILVGLLAAALVALGVRLVRLRATAAAAPRRLAEVEARVERAVGALRQAEGALDGRAPEPPTEGRGDGPAERRPGRRRVRRVGPPATPDRP